ncbi:hypothetical protein ABVT39_001954, partial [Epinephelus coioides]
YVGGNELALFQSAPQLLSPPVTVAFCVVDPNLTRWMCRTQHERESQLNVQNVR